MRILPSSFLTVSQQAVRPQAALAPAGPRDSVQLGQAQPAYSHLGSTGFSTASQVAVGTGLTLGAMGRGLDAQGVKFQYMGRGLDFWNEKWKDAPGEKAASYIQDGTRVQFQLPGHGWAPLTSAETLGMVFAFHGGGNLRSLQHPQLGEQVEALARSGVSLRDESHNTLPAWQAYQRLASGQRVVVPEGTLHSPEEASLAVFLKTGAAPNLSRPELAAHLKSLQGYQLSSGDPFATYRSNPAEVALQAHGETLLTWKTDQAPDLSALAEQRKRLEELRGELGAEPAGKVWRLLASDGSERPYAERLDLYRATRGEALYREALAQSAGQDLTSLSARLRAVKDHPQPLEAARALAQSHQPERFLECLKSFPRLEVAQRLAVLPPEAVEVVRNARPEWKSEGAWSSHASGWKDNPGGAYTSNLDISLTSRGVSLQGVQDAVLGFEAGWSLEKDRDHVFLEIRPRGGDWRSLETYTGDGAMAPRRVSLRSFVNQDIELRFRLKTDSSVEKEGFQLQNLALTALGPAGQRILLTHQSGGEMEELLTELERPGQNVALLSEFLGRYASTAEGMAAWRSLGPAPDPEQAAALSKLSQELGSRTAVAIWPDLVRGAGSWEERKNRAVETHDLGVRLARARRSDDLELAYATIKPLSDEARRSLDRLLASSSKEGWQSQGGWGYDPAEKAWSTNPGLEAYSNNARETLLGPTLDLTGRQGTSLRFEARWELEDKYDFVQLQASTDGQEWKDLSKYGGSNGWTGQSLSLSAYDGQKVQLRWLLITDGSGERKGLVFRNFSVQSAGEDLVFRDEPDRARQTCERLFELAASQESDALAGAAALLDEVSASQALALQPVLARAGSRAGEVRALVSALGVEAAVSQADLVLAGRGAEEVGAAYQCARMLAQALGSPLRSELPAQMLQAGFDIAMSADLSTLARSFQVYEGPTRWVRRPDGSMDDSPDQSYKSNDTSILQTREVDLRGLATARLTYEASHALEDKYDHIYVEVDDGSGWKGLAIHDGTQGMQPYSRDLSAYRDKSVRVRFRLTSDGSNEREGMILRKLAIGGNNAAGKPEVRLQDHGTRPDGLEMLTRSVFRPGQDQATLKETLSTLRMLTEGLGDPGQALEVWDLAGSDPDKARDLGLLVHYAGWEDSRKLWFVLQDLPADQRTRKTELLALGAQLAEAGLDALRLQQRLEGSDLDSEALGILAGLSNTARVGAWRAEGTWSRVETPAGPGWADSPAGNYRPNEKSALTSPAIDLRGVEQPRLRYQASFDTESGNDRILVEASGDGVNWQQLQSHTGSSGWTTFESDLSQYAGGSVRLRYTLVTDGSVEKEGFSVGGLVVVDPAGKELFRDRGGLEVMEDVLELACDVRTPLDSRKQALTVLGGMPNGLGWRALALLREEEKAGRLKGLSLAQLVARLPAALVSDNLDEALARIVKESASTGILEEEKAIVVGGARVKRRQDATEAGPAEPSTSPLPSSS